jgi:ADP-ribose pyrophosphatase YjhB (NUDIX family)
VYILLVTSRETKRWVIPEGWPSKKVGDPKAAAREAREEAGITVKIDRKSVGTYTYRKVFPNSSRLVDVVVYPLWVKKQSKNWREKSERARIWATFEEAALVREPGLKRLFTLATSCPIKMDYRTFSEQSCADECQQRGENRHLNPPHTTTAVPRTCYPARTSSMLVACASGVT